MVFLLGFFEEMVKLLVVGGRGLGVYVGCVLVFWLIWVLMKRFGVVEQEGLIFFQEFGELKGLDQFFLRCEFVIIFQVVVKVKCVIICFLGDRFLVLEQDLLFRFKGREFLFVQKKIFFLFQGEEILIRVLNGFWFLFLIVNRLDFFLSYGIRI